MKLTREYHIKTQNFNELLRIIKQERKKYIEKGYEIIEIHWDNEVHGLQKLTLIIREKLTDTVDFTYTTTASSSIPEGFDELFAGFTKKFKNKKPYPKLIDKIPKYKKRKKSKKRS